MASLSEQFGTAALDIFKFFTIQFLSTVMFYNLTLNVNKKFLQIPLLEPTPYKINEPVSFLEDLTKIIFNGFQSGLTAKIYYKIQERSIQLVKFGNLII